MDCYREMYYKLMTATEKALRILICAQRECEELYLSSEQDFDQTESDCLDRKE